MGKWKEDCKMNTGEVKLMEETKRSKKGKTKGEV
jgi:hypothetical protein